MTCTDEEIKRYYRRQAFLVHPDKNQQPGAEEAFKILQHAFDLIGEPVRFIIFNYSKNTFNVNVVYIKIGLFER